MGFHGPHGLGDAVAAHGAGHRLVGEDGVGVHFDVFTGIQLGEGAGALGADAVAVGGVGALVGEGFQLAGGVGAVRPHPGYDMIPDRMARPVADEGFFPGNVQLDQMAAGLQAQPGAEGFVENVLLVAEAAADIGLDHPDFSPVHAQGLAHHPPDDVRDLGGGGHGDPAAFHFGKADEILNMAVLHHRRFVPAFHLRQAGFLNRLRKIAVADLRVLQDVVREVFVQLRRAVLHGLAHIQHEGILLVFHADQPQGLRRRHLVLRHDGRDIVAVKPHPVREDQPVRHVLVIRIRGPRMPRRREIMLFLQVKTGQDLHDAGHLFRFRRVE